MTFKSKIFIPDNKWYNKYALSTKLFALSVVGLIISGIIIAITDGKITNNILIRTFQAFMLLTTIGPLLLMMVIAPFEYEKLNGEFGENLTITENEIIINNKKYLYIDIKEFEVKILTFYGMRTVYSRRYGPTYYQGINNEISILFNNKVISTFFLISSESQMEKLQKIIFNVILKEKIKFKYKYLDYIADDLKTTSDYKSFIQKLKTENRLLVK